MNRQQLYQALENPAVAGNISVDELEKLRNEYPWFSTAQILLARAYQWQDDHRLTDQLQHASLFAGNRRKLYQYLQKANSGERTDIPDSSSSIPLRDELQAEAALPVAVEKSIEPPASENDVFFDLFPDPATRTFSDDSSGPVEGDELHILAKRILESDQEKGKEPETAELDLMSFVPEPPPAIPQTEKSDRGNSAAGEMPVLPPTRVRDSTEERRPMDPLEKDILAEAVSSSIEQEVSISEEDHGKQPFSDETEDEGTTAEQAEAGTSDYFTSWLVRRAREIQYDEGDLGASESHAYPAIPLPLAGPPPDSVAVPKEEKRPTGETSKQAHQQELIDRFMRLDPKITPGKSGDYDTQNIARESLEEDANLVTETMARLFALQGRMDKARKAYRRLMELYPEKSIYFAAQLKNLNSTKKG